MIPDAIYLCRNQTEVAIVRLKLLRGGRFNVLVEYAKEDGTQYAEPSLGKVDYRGYVWGADQPDPRDLVEFIEFLDLTEYPVQ
jgi:hypothetical protein